MATYYARANGNVNATNVWSTTAGGATSDLFPSFTNADTLMANGFTVTLNVNTTVLEIRNDNANGATAGGSFSCNNGIILNGNVVAGTAACVTLATTVSATINGNITGGSAANAVGVSMGSTGTLTIVGTITGGTVSSSAHGINISAIGTINITGNLIGSANIPTGAINTAASAIINIVGNITSGAVGYGITVNSSVIMSITGTINGAGGVAALGCFQALPTITVIGTAVGGSSAGITNNTAGPVYVTRAKGGPLASSSVGVSAAAAAVVYVEEIEYGDLGASPVSGPIRLTDKKSNVAIMYRFGTTKKTLTDATATSGLIPSTNDVRRNIIYNGGNNVGTMDVPAAASVALGVAVDNTTGTAILTSGNIGDIWNYPVSGVSVSNSIGERLKNCSTVASMGQQLAAALSNIN